MNIAIVILNWNGRSLLEQFLPSVVAFSSNATIYVADNASSDDSIAYVKSNFPEIHIIQNDNNYGYAQGYNVALSQIQADVYCLLNSDVEVSKNWLHPIETTFKTHQDIAIIQPKILDYKNKTKFEYAGAAGGYIDRYAYPFCRGRIFDHIETDFNQYSNTDIFWASGACLFIRSEVFKQLQGFDSRFFAHYEEIDLCWRAQNLGHRIYYVGESTVFHVGGATLHALNPQKTYLNFRNSLFALVKNSNENLPKVLFVRLCLDGLAGLKFLFSFKLSHLWAILRAHFSFYTHFFVLLKERKNNKNRRNYFTINSIALQYFIKKNETFDKL